MPFAHSCFNPIDREAITAARLIPLQVVQNKGNGHAGTAMALAPLAHVLFSHVLLHNPNNPNWLGRDRFILSAGHASLLLYIQQYFTGYGLTLKDIAQARTFGSKTPGHPEFNHTPGVEMSTGPLGQGVASAVGMALAAKHERSLFDPENTAPAHLWDHTIWVLAGDGCLQEGVSAEASSLAGTLKLDNLVLIWDDNNITIDSTTQETFSEDVRNRYRAYGWRVLELPDANDIDAIKAVLEQAKTRCGQPTLVALKSVIGYPSPNKSGTSAAHAGIFGEAEVAATKKQLGFDPETQLEDLVPPHVLEHTRQALQRGIELERLWNEALSVWETSNPDAATARTCWYDQDTRNHSWNNTIDTILDGLTNTSELSTRNANQIVLRSLHKHADLQHGLWGGSADLAGSTSVAIDGEPFSDTFPEGSFIRFGIREHAMMAILSGICLHGPWRSYGSTYLAFSDYMRPALRLSALMQLGTLAIFTHDSVAVGEDGPTHQPVEHLMSLRTIPGLDVIRPADARETVAAWKRISINPHRPVALILSRQDLPVLPATDSLCESVAAGGYVIAQFGNGLDLALLATGSEVSLSIQAAQLLAEEGIQSRVVSIPCTQWFDEQPAQYREHILPSNLRARLAVEAGATSGWWKYVGLDGNVLGIDQFGISGSASQVMETLGMTVDNIVKIAREVIRHAT